MTREFVSLDSHLCNQEGRDPILQQDSFIVGPFDVILKVPSHTPAGEDVVDPWNINHVPACIRTEPPMTREFVSLDSHLCNQEGRDRNLVEVFGGLFSSKILSLLAPLTLFSKCQRTRLPGRMLSILGICLYQTIALVLPVMRQFPNS
jgi:hypothetical protein